MDATRRLFDAIAYSGERFADVARTAWRVRAETEDPTAAIEAAHALRV